MTPPDASVRASAAINFGINQQSALMAYNDTELIMGIILLFIIPLVFLLPGKLKAENKIVAE